MAKRASRSAQPAMLIEGTILVYDRAARSDVVEAFKRAGWKSRGVGEAKGYVYLSRSECNGDTPRYLTSGTRSEIDRLQAALVEVLNEGGGGFDPYLEG